MALNLETLKQRSLTAVVFVIVMLVGLLWNQWSFFVLFTVIHFGCWIEYQKLITRIDPDYGQISRFHRYLVMIAGWCFLLYFTNDSYNLFGIRFHEIGWWIGLLLAFTLPIVELLFAGQIQSKNIANSALGILYISLSFGLLIDLRSADYSENFLRDLQGWVIPVVMIASIWINDTMAYIVGSLIGKTPLTKISPKKTWEGTLGGAILAMIIITLGMYFIDPLRPIWFWAGLAAIAAIVGTLGDLLESKLKRMANVKDSGSIMPGHGGFLDRFDSLLLATPAVWAYVNIVAWSNT